MKRFATAVIVAILCAVPLFAQETDPALEPGYYHGFTTDADMQAPVRDTSIQTRGVRYGGWLSPVIADQRNYNGDSSFSSSITTARLWIKAPLWQDSFFYVRGKDVFMAVIHQEGTSAKTIDNTADLDLAYLSMAFMRNNLWFSFGRRFFRVGTGLVLNDRGDGVQSEVYTPCGNFTIFGMYTGLFFKDSNPYYVSTPDKADGARRIFTGMTYEKSIYNHSVYLFGMGQIDMGKEDAGTQTRYQSQYWGVGGKGTVEDNIAYYIEGFGETGKSYLNGTSKQKNILAWGGTAGINYYLKGEMSPVVQFQYSCGSGDKSRDYTDKATGNTGGMDTYLVTFGTFSGGSGLRPELSNIHVLRVGGSILPLDDMAGMGKVMLIAKYSIYLKNNSGGDIYAAGSAQNTGNGTFAGQGLDASARWQVYSDLGLYLSYGLFIPGTVYPEGTDPGHLLVGGATVSF